MSDLLTTISLDHPSEPKNILLMMRFRDTPQNRLIAESIINSAREYDLFVLRADQHYYYNTLWDNVRAYMDVCAMGIAVFDKIADDDFNPNVSLELGYMLAHQKKLLLLKEQNLKSLPSDVTGHLYREFDAFNIENSVKYAVHSWLRDVGIAKSRDEKLILFMSHGGTCRCAMAKIILRQALRRRNLPFKMRVESVARWYGSSDSASHGAIKAIKDVYGEDLLCDHRVTRICPGYLRDADLILTMEKELAEGIQCEHLPKIQTFNRFFRDSEEDLLDPWPDDVPEAPAKYKACLEDIRSAIVPNVDRITRFLAS